MDYIILGIALLAGLFVAGAVVWVIRFNRRDWRGRGFTARRVRYGRSWLHLVTTCNGEFIATDEGAREAFNVYLEED